MEELKQSQLDAASHSDSNAAGEQALKDKQAELAKALADLAALQKKLESQNERLKALETEHNSRGGDLDKIRGEFAKN